MSQSNNAPITPGKLLQNKFPPLGIHVTPFKRRGDGIGGHHRSGGATGGPRRGGLGTAPLGGIVPEGGSLLPLDAGFSQRYVDGYVLPLCAAATPGDQGVQVALPDHDHFVVPPAGEETAGGGEGRRCALPPVSVEGVEELALAEVPDL